MAGLPETQRQEHFSLAYIRAIADTWDSGSFVVVDVRERCGYDRAVTEAPAVEQTRLANAAARDRQDLIAAIEDGLADLDAGRPHTHAEVLAEMRRLFPPPKT